MINTEANKELNEMLKDVDKTSTYITTFLYNVLYPELELFIKDLKEEVVIEGDKTQVYNLTVSRLIRKAFEENDTKLIYQFHNMCVCCNVLESLDFKKYTQLVELHPIISTIKLCIFQGYSNYFVQKH